MPRIRDWQGIKEMSTRLLKQRTGEDVDTWNQRIRKEGPDDKSELTGHSFGRFSTQSSPRRQDLAKPPSRLARPETPGQPVQRQRSRFRSVGLAAAGV